MPSSLPADTVGIHVPACSDMKFGPELVNSWVCCRYDADNCATDLYLLLCHYSEINGRPLKLSVGSLSSHPKPAPWRGCLRPFQEGRGNGLGGRGGGFRFSGGWRVLGWSRESRLAELDSHDSLGGGGRAGRLPWLVGAGPSLGLCGRRDGFPGTGDGCWCRVQLSEVLGRAVQLSGCEGQLLVSGRAPEAAERRLWREEAAEAPSRLGLCSPAHGSSPLGPGHPDLPALHMPGRRPDPGRPRGPRLGTALQAQESLLLSFLSVPGRDQHSAPLPIPDQTRGQPRLSVQ